MDGYVLDETDRELLNLLQENARYTAIELAEEIGVSDNTVHNRIAQLEDNGVIEGYTAVVDHDTTHLDFTYLFVCTTRISNRGTVADRALDIAGVTDVTELMTGERNLLIKAIGSEKSEITALARKLDNLNLELNDEILIREDHVTSPNYDQLG